MNESNDVIRDAGQLGVPGLQNAEKGIRAQKLNSFFHTTNERIFR